MPVNAGQFLIIGFDGTEMKPRLASLLTRVQPAGVILFARNVKTADQTYGLLRDCQALVDTPLLTCVDLEGGSVDRFRDVLGSTPSAADVFACGDRSLYRKHGEVIGTNCRAMGFNVDFAPVLDLAFEASHQVMGSRAVSANPRQVAIYAREFLNGLHTAGVLGCGKHFPGIGEGALDSHHELPLIDKPLGKLWSEDLLPYRTLRRQLPLVMVSHAAYPKVTRDQTPASLSKAWITGILRKRIGYRNLILSDDMEMGAVLSAASIGDAAVQFVRAGGDLCLVCHRDDRVLEAYERITLAAEHDKKFAQRASESVKRVLALKKKWAEMLRPSSRRRGATGPSAASVERLTRKLWEFSEQVRLESLDRKQDREQDRKEDRTGRPSA